MNLGVPELLIIALVIFLLFGATRLPNAARSLGRSMRIFKSEMDEMKTDKKGEAADQQAIEQQQPQAQNFAQQPQQPYQQGQPQVQPQQQPYNQGQPQRNYGQQDYPQQGQQ